MLAFPLVASSKSAFRKEAIMKIGIDARNLVPKLSGIGRYVSETSRHLIELGHEVVLYLPEPEWSREYIPASAVKRVSMFRGALPRIVWGNTVLPRLVIADRCDIFWGPAHRLPLLGWMGIPQVLTLHDLVWYHAAQTMRARGWIGERAFMKQSIKRADRIVAVSSATRSDVSELYPWTVGKIDVVYPGLTPLARAPDPDALAKFAIDRPFVLFVGTLEPRKNLSNLLKAFALLPEAVGSQFLLIIAGGQGWGRDDLVSEIGKLGLTSRVRLTGFISDPELATLYQTARFLAMPSQYEGFGLPLIEANAAGIPTLTSNVSSMPEVGGEAALLIDPRSVESISFGMAQLMTDEALYIRLSCAAKANAARFSWKKSAVELSEVFARTCN